MGKTKNIDKLSPICHNEDRTEGGMGLKRFFICVLACCLMLTACAKKAEEQVQSDPAVCTTEEDMFSEEAASAQVPSAEETPVIPEEKEIAEESPAAAEPAPETEEEEKPAPTPPPAPKYEPLTAVAADAERIVGASGYGLSVAMEDMLLSLQNGYYQSVGGLAVQECDALFSKTEEANRHEAIWRTLIEIRKASLIDLHLTSYNFTFYCTGVSWNGEDEVRITVAEDAVMYFAATSYVPSEQFDVTHTFVLDRTGQDSWKIKSHTSDDNPYENFVYDKNNQCDSRLGAFLSSISARQAQRGGGTGTDKTWQHDYDRAAAYAYMQTYAAYRNGEWRTYDYSGGNCQNFGSQVLHAGGIPMDQEGDAQWYWKNHYDQNYSWINVTRFYNYAAGNTGYGLVADTSANYYTGQTGDILIMGDGDMEHTTVIADTITDGSGTVDYLICSNTSNYRNFPASAYYYTYHWVVRILGWNDVLPPAEEDPDPTPGEGGTSSEGGTSEEGEKPSEDPVPDGTEPESPSAGDGEEIPPAAGGNEENPPADGGEGEEVLPPVDDTPDEGAPEDDITSA